MAQESFNLNVYTPAGILLKESVGEVTLPTAMGEIGVLPGHASYTGILAEGILSYSQGSSAKKSLKVSGGFAAFSGNTLTVLADSAGAGSTEG